MRITDFSDTRKHITREDRCDKCGAEAKVRATLVNGELHFCGHHARQIGTELVRSSIEVFDPEGCFNER